MKIEQLIAAEIGATTSQVNNAVQLLDDGATVPFISRYRKEATGGLDDTQLRQLDSRLRYLRELEERRATILNSIREQGKLDAVLETSIVAADSKTRLEDLYRPYMPKRRTKAQIAREAGLEPLALGLYEDPERDPQQFAEGFINIDAGVADAEAALDGAQQILMEKFAEDADLLAQLRQHLWQNGMLESRLVKGKADEGKKFADYFEYQEAIRKIPSHRALALFRGRNEGILSLNLILAEAEHSLESGVCEQMIARYWQLVDQGRKADAWLQHTIRWTWKVKLFTQLDLELKKRLREMAEAEAIKVFAANLRDLLLAAPAGPRVTMGLDPGIRTGVKVALVDDTGKLLDTTTIYPHAPKHDWQGALRTLSALVQKYQVSLISIGNGTASRETDKLAADLIQALPSSQIHKIIVSEAGASVYSASEMAAREFPELDVSLRGAVSIARRLQDPLAELVKIDPKAIGVGQYQHDVSQTQLGKSLGAVVEDCVNAVGVDVNMASAPLLSHISGLNSTLAENIVAYRDQHGAFRERRQLLQVPRLGEKAFEQCAGFLRIMQGDNPLDASCVHPEAYPLVERILQQSQRKIDNVIGDSGFLSTIAANDFADERFGEPTVRDILRELEKPGRDPRPQFKSAVFKDGVNEMKDLKPGMRLEGVVTNVTNFGAFVDIGVHQDGLVHISLLADRFVQDPRDVVKAGQVVQVKVMEVDISRKRIGLSMRLDEITKADNETEKPRPKSKTPPGKAPGRSKPVKSVTTGALADAFKRAKNP